MFPTTQSGVSNIFKKEQLLHVRLFCIDDSHYIRTRKDAPQIVINSDSETDSIASFHTTSCTATDAKEMDILSFGCTYLYTFNRFIISTTSICFTSAVGHALPYASFHKPYSELVEMPKRQVRSSILGPLAKVTTGVDKLELTFRGPGGNAGIHGMGEKAPSEVAVLDNMLHNYLVFLPVYRSQDHRTHFPRHIQAMQSKSAPEA